MGTGMGQISSKAVDTERAKRKNIRVLIEVAFEQKWTEKKEKGEGCGRKVFLDSHFEIKDCLVPWACFVAVGEISRCLIIRSIPFFSGKCQKPTMSLACDVSAPRNFKPLTRSKVTVSNMTQIPLPTILQSIIIFTLSLFFFWLKKRICYIPSNDFCLIQDPNTLQND